MPTPKPLFEKLEFRGDLYHHQSNPLRHLENTGIQDWGFCPVIQHITTQLLSSFPKLTLGLSLPFCNSSFIVHSTPAPFITGLFFKSSFRFTA